MKIELLKSVVTQINYIGSATLDNLVFYVGKILGRFIFPFQVISDPKHFISHPSYFPECALKNRTQILIDQLFYIFRTGEINKSYFLYGFDRKGKNDFQNYVPWFTFTRARNSKNQRSLKPIYDPYNYVCLLRDKFVFEAFCKRLGLNTPTNIGMIRLGTVYLIESKRNILIENIIELELDAFCKRNVSYGGGMAEDIIKLNISSGKIYINNKPIAIEKFKHLIGNDLWIIQNRIKNQNLEYSNFHPNSINTIRIVTINTGSTIELFYSFFRMGVNGRHADNWSSGGIVTGINNENGTLEKYGFYRPGIGTKCDRHPNSGIIFQGYILPFWHEAVEYVKSAHRLFYGLHSIGWDVCITTDGIVLIEGNDNWDTSGSQFYKGASNEFALYFKSNNNYCNEHPHV